MWPIVVRVRSILSKLMTLEVCAQDYKLRLGKFLQVYFALWDVSISWPTQ